MENIVSVPHNKGALPRDYEELQISDSFAETGEEEQSAEFIGVSEFESEADKPAEPLVYTHVRTPELRRSGTRILMGITAACGAVSGAVIAYTGNADPEAVEAVSGSLVGTFQELFARSALIGAVFLAAELLLGFFALGDWLVWVLPLCYAMGTALRVAVAETGILLPSSAAGVCAVAFAAATSAGFSQTLLRLSKGGTVYLDSSPRKSYILSFLGYAVIIAAAAAYEGIALNWI